LPWVETSAGIDGLFLIGVRPPIEVRRDDAGTLRDRLIFSFFTAWEFREIPTARSARHAREPGDSIGGIPREAWNPTIRSARNTGESLAGTSGKTWDSTSWTLRASRETGNPIPVWTTRHVWKPW